jgi:pyruvate,water dikinase
LIAPATDAGWIPTFSQVSGAAVETGGDLSHGSIILRELQLPAITNAKGIMRNIKTGDIVSLIATEGVLMIVMGIIFSAHLKKIIPMTIIRTPSMD